MTLGGWIIMGLSVGGTVIFFLWCFWRVLTSPEGGADLHAAIDASIEPGDDKEE